ncbi:hypothetical protein Rhe02_58760 [Rhizocola hellebori]|uniref:TIR domain-containing protein n=1 Tax=Rhizocola hellebori TaxID=1392758 RepID=A0A8J3VHV3_9ACTN|nr:TIR domain-containing protein [Rhizocola hellebori]GIH07809.1 hypothetical protein Rhe02_58760 [Rhizocola hellebori]
MTRFGVRVPYAAFVSYSRAVDGKLAPALQHALQRLTKRWYQRRAIRVFRDDASLTANPGLWSSIVEALDQSEFFVLLASPEAAQSEWVRREVSHWLHHRPVGTLLIAVTDGELRWDPATGGFDPDRTTCLPPELLRAFAEEPRWVDLRAARHEEHLSLRVPHFKDKIAELAAAVHRKSKDDIVGQDIREHQRTVRLVQVIVAIFALLAVTATVQWRRADSQAAIATAGRLADQSAALLDSDPAVAMQLAVAAYRTADTAVTRSALLSARSRGHAGRLLGHRAPVGKIATSDDGALAVSADTAGTIMLWRLSPLDRVPVVLRTDRGPQPATGSAALAFIPGTRILAEAGWVGSVTLWNLANPATPRHMSSVDVQRDEIRSLAASADGRWLAGAGLDRTWLWRVEAATLSGQTVVATASATQVAFGAGSDVLYVAGFGPDLRVFDLTDHAHPRALPAVPTDSADVGALAVSFDGYLLATGGAGGQIRLWSLADPRSPVPAEHHVLASDHRDVTSLAFHGRSLAAGGFEGRLRVWDTQTGTTTVDQPNAYGIDALAVTATGLIVTGARDHIVRVWRHASSVHPGTIGNIFTVAIGQNGTVAAATADGQVYLRNVHRDRFGTWQPTWRAHDDSIAAIAFTPKETHLLTASYDHTVGIWRLGSGQPTLCHRIADSWAPLRAIAISGTLLAVGGNDPRVRLYDLKNPCDPVLLTEFNAPTHIVGGHTVEAVEALALDAEGTMLAVGRFSDPHIHLWSVANPRALRHIADLRGHLFGVRALAFSANGSVLASGADDGSALLWDMAALGERITPKSVVWAQPMAAPLTHGKSVAGIAFSGDGRKLATAGYDGTVAVWDSSRPNRPNLIARLAGHRSSVEAVAIAQGGDFVVSGADDATLMLWSLDAQQVAAWICEVTITPLTPAEWAAYLPDIAYRAPCG